jgi:hypothetical protein
MAEVLAACVGAMITSLQHRANKYLGKGGIITPGFVPFACSGE